MSCCENVSLWTDFNWIPGARSKTIVSSIIPCLCDKKHTQKGNHQAAEILKITNLFHGRKTFDLNWQLPRYFKITWSKPTWLPPNETLISAFKRENVDKHLTSFSIFPLNWFLEVLDNFKGLWTFVVVVAIRLFLVFLQLCDFHNVYLSHFQCF